jgi:exosortase
MRLAIKRPAVPARWYPLLIASPLALTALWAYWPALGRMAQVWQHNPQYSYGYLVPAFALVVLWCRRDRLASAAPACSWWGVLLLGAAAALRLAGTYFFVNWLDDVSLLVCLAGAAVVAGKWAGWRWSWPALGFLGFMIPLPYQVELALGQPLQRLATLASAYVLQTLGQPAVAEGNVISLGDLSIGVVEACNGLSMLVVLAALCTAAAMVLRRPAWQKAVLVASALPIAVAANVVRIVITALLFQVAGGEAARALFHDWAGLMMMPLAVGLLAAELAVLARLLAECDPPRPVPLRRRDADKKPRAKRPGRRSSPCCASSRS